MGLDLSQCLWFVQLGEVLKQNTKPIIVLGFGILDTDCFLSVKELTMAGKGSLSSHSAPILEHCREFLWPKDRTLHIINYPQLLISMVLFKKLLIQIKQGFWFKSLKSSSEVWSWCVPSLATTAHINKEILLSWQGVSFLPCTSWSITIYPKSHVFEIPQIFTVLQKSIFRWTNSSVHSGRKRKKLYLGLLPLASCISAWPRFDVKSFYFKKKGQSHASVASPLWSFGPSMDIAAEFI